MSKPDKVIPEKCINFPMQPTTSKVTARDAIIYAIGIVYSADPMNLEDLKYTYELNEEFKICPTFGNSQK